MLKVKISDQQRRTIVTGVLASVLAWLFLNFLVRVMHLAPQYANIPSLALGSLTQFLGNRFYVFKSRERHYTKQATEYFFVEVCGFFLNNSLYTILVRWTPINFAVAQPLSSLCIFIFFSYPMWRWVFRK